MKRLPTTLLVQQRYASAMNSSLTTRAFCKMENKNDLWQVLAGKNGGDEVDLLLQSMITNKRITIPIFLFVRFE